MGKKAAVRLPFLFPYSLSVSVPFPFSIGFIMYLSGGQENGKRQTMPFRSVIMTDVMSYGIDLFLAFS